jgi:hypothetical protein
MDTINAAIQELTSTVAREEWRTVTVAVAPSTVQVKVPPFWTRILKVLGKIIPEYGRI